MREVDTLSITQICREKLLSFKKDILNRVRTEKMMLDQTEKSGDESDLAAAALAENTFLISFERMRNQLLEIEFALSRIESGQYGICEETDEPIETDRLLAIPWTRLSIEGAEIRESQNKRHARR